MTRRDIGTALTAAALIGALVGILPRPALGQEEPAPRKSVYGTLDSVIEGQRAVVMRSDDGERLVWRFPAEVVDAVKAFEPGAEMIVIYRQTDPNQKIVTAVAFPGTASRPTYVNLTGSRVVLWSGPATGEDSCDVPSTDVSETPIIAGGQAETDAACWCCSVGGEACAPTTKTGLGRAFLIRCFE